MQHIKSFIYHISDASVSANISKLSGSLGSYKSVIFSAACVEICFMWLS